MIYFQEASLLFLLRNLNFDVLACYWEEQLESHFAFFQVKKEVDSHGLRRSLTFSCSVCDLLGFFEGGGERKMCRIGTNFPLKSEMSS